ncbi:MAG: hypothetical protein HY876_06575 [Coriobacteriales bacterium]|nr:hypothetical protein [Coriobacteriales bacterium]
MTSLNLIAAYYRLRGYASTYGLLLMVFASTAVVFMALLWPAFRYYHTASANAATWDIHVNGPITSLDTEEIVRIAGPTAQWSSASHGGLHARVVRNGRSTTNGDSYVINRVSGEPFALTWAPPGIVLSGRLDSPDSAGLDWVTARRLHARIGDTLVYRKAFVDPEGAERAFTGSARITAILSTTYDSRGLIFIAPKELERALQSTVGIAASDVFIRVKQPERVASKLKRLPAARNWGVVTKAEYHREALAGAEGSGAHSYGERGVLVAAAVLLALILRDLLVRISRRRRSLAILYSLGSRPRPLVVAHVIEQLVLLSVILVAGYLAGPRLLVTVTGLYPPAETLRSIAVLWLGGSILLVAVCATYVFWSMRERSLVLLASDLGE